ncbi:trans-aconitate 2-methyltransferase [Vandammella animalimorsus]|uniref:trans-aconitate 2-methyltransferase n=1 Tax=Vandammella animalimorsus TaxID=2029117 RepID=UPI00325BAEB1
MNPWDPALYRSFEQERTRPAAELLARVPLAQARCVVDLGCGPGNSTELLLQRFGKARLLLGLDSSTQMLASARARLPQERFANVQFVQGDIATWVPDEPPELIFANASLHWVPEHACLLPRLFAALAPGGVLAVQMPDNLAEPSHQAMRELAAQAPWQATIAQPEAARTLLLTAAAYYDLLAPQAQSVDVWHTIYQHPMASPAAIVQWLQGSGLRPFVQALPADLRASYLSAYEQRIAKLYPARSDGSRLLAYPRLFLVARRPS